MKKWQPSAIIREIPYSNLETAGETVQKLESPGLSRRGDGTVSGTSSSANIFIKVKVHLK